MSDRRLLSFLSHIGVALCLFAATAACSAGDVDPLLRKADGYRLPAASAQVETRVEQYRRGELDKERDYTVYIKPGRRSLILMKTAAELGQKVLMLGDNFWLFVPDSQRPLRITANQKLLGEASTGDIAEMSWHEDYDGRLVDETDCPKPPEVAAAVPGRVGEGRCLQLELQALRNGVTYARIDLLLEKNSKFPVKADLIMGSGKKAKEAWYFEQAVQGRRQVGAMLLFDHIQTTRHTVVHYRKLAAREAPDELFNPAALVRNSLAEW